MDARLATAEDFKSYVDGLIQETPTDFQVSRKLYTDEALFRIEMNRIFGRCWIYVGHESEIPNLTFMF